MTTIEAPCINPKCDSPDIGTEAWPLEDGLYRFQAQCYDCGSSGPVCMTDQEASDAWFAILGYAESPGYCRKGSEGAAMTDAPQYHSSCPHCFHIWWSYDPFPTNCPECDALLYPAFAKLGKP
jgi:hypothetical protein